MNDLQNQMNNLVLEEEPQPPTQVTIRESKLPDVANFGGNPKNSFQFLSQLNVFFHLQPIRFATDMSKCYYFGLRCQGPAAVWFNSVLIGPDAEEIISDYERFVQEFNLTFDDPTRVHDAERRLLTMKQGKRSVCSNNSRIQD